MSPEKLDQLEKLFSVLLGELHTLRAETGRLLERVEQLEGEKEKLAEQHKKTRADLEQLGILERANRKMEEEKSQIRLKIKNILVNLDKLDLA